MQVKLNGRLFPVAEASSKKVAKKDAAAATLRILMKEMSGDSDTLEEENSTTVETLNQVADIGVSFCPVLLGSFLCISVAQRVIYKPIQVFLPSNSTRCQQKGVAMGKGIHRCHALCLVGRTQCLS